MYNPRAAIPFVVLEGTFYNLHYYCLEELGDNHYSLYARHTQLIRYIRSFTPPQYVSV